MQDTCYRFHEVARCDEPLLPVDATFVLTMEGSGRMPALMGQPVVRRLAPKTIVQTNTGFRRCHKRYVSDSSKDICHAYRNVFLRSQGLGTILILEDDALFDVPDIEAHLRRVSDYVKSARNFDIYSLGSLIVFMHPVSLRHRNALVWSGAHAMLWTEYARQTLTHSINSSGASGVHIDGLAQKHLRVHTYYRPIATQLISHTENSETWCVSCEKGSRVDVALRALLLRLIAISGVHSATRPHWDILSAGGFGCLFDTTLTLILVFFVIFVMRLIAKRKLGYIE